MNNRVYCAVLAAGTSSRFGSTKQLADIGGQSMVARAAATAEQACPGRTLLVAGHDAMRVVAASGGHCRGTAINANHAQGIGSSIACAARALQHVADGLLITLADQPLVSASHLAELLKTFEENPDRPVASRYASTLGPPVIFPRSMLPRLVGLDGDRGAKRLLESADCVEIPCEDAAVDVDRPGDLDAIQ